jgi:hypothetical protein
MNLNVNWKKVWGALGSIVGVLIVLAAIGLFVFYAGWVDFVDNYEVGYKYDVRVGKIQVLTNPDGTLEKGWVINPPVLVKVHTIDLRPMQVCLSPNQRVLNCKLVQFNYAGIQKFLSWHGRADYEGPGNNVSSAGSVSNSFAQLLMIYAYDEDPSQYEFLNIIKELNSSGEIELGQVMAP